MTPIPRPRAISLTLLVLLAACSREEPAAHEPITPAIAPAQNPHLTDKAHILSADIDAAGASSSYDAHFTEGQLTRIVERRAGAAAGSAEGEYAFRGARLVRYVGARLQGGGALTLDLDMQGQIVDARIDGEPAPPEEVDAIRSRAQLLRSHALAQNAARAHVPR